MGFGSTLPSPGPGGSRPTMSLDLIGERELFRLLTDLPSRIERKVIGKALNAAAGPVKRAIAMRAKAHQLTGLMAKSIVVTRPRKYRRATVFLVVIGPRSQRIPVRRTKKGTWRGVGKKVAARMEAAGQKLTYINPAKYAHLVELGHGGRSPAPPYPFMRPGWESTKRVAAGTLLDYLWTGALSEARKLAMAQGNFTMPPTAGA